MDLLQIRDGRIVNAGGDPIRLRGTCVGGWMNMENFINGYSGAEYTLRATFADILGPGKAQFFFDRLLDHFLTEDDIAFMKQLGATVVRLSVNYRHFERDDAPFEYLEAGFERLDRALDWCAKHELYAILDLHSVQGWQNTDWHCDNANRAALFWTHAQFQDRFVALWEQFARRYKGNPALAAYNIMNEPLTDAPAGRFTDVRQPRWDVMNAVYRRTVEAIRAIDPDHIIVLEGDSFSSRFDGLAAPFAPNLLYSSHNYNGAGFGPGPYPGAEWDRDRQYQQFANAQGTQFMQQHNVPLWVGEFGSVYNGPPEEVPDRLRALDDYLDVFEDFGVHWTTWTYKDVGVMGLVTLDPESAYIQRIAPFLEAKATLDTDFWMGWLPDDVGRQMTAALRGAALEVIDDAALDAPVRYLRQNALAGYMGGLMQPTFARLFADLTEEAIDDMLSAFALANCRVNDGLAEVLKKHFARPA